MKKVLILLIVLVIGISVAYARENKVELPVKMILGEGEELIVPISKEIRRLSEGVSLNSMVTVSWIKGSVRNTLYSITELPNQEEEK